MEQLKNLQQATNNLVLQLIATNIIVGDMINLRAAPSIIPGVDDRLKVLLELKLSAQLDELGAVLTVFVDRLSEVETYDKEDSNI